MARYKSSVESSICHQSKVASSPVRVKFSFLQIKSVEKSSICSNLLVFFLVVFTCIMLQVSILCLLYSMCIAVAYGIPIDPTKVRVISFSCLNFGYKKQNLIVHISSYLIFVSIQFSSRRKRPYLPQANLSKCKYYLIDILLYFCYNLHFTILQVEKIVDRRDQCNSDRARHRRGNASKHAQLRSGKTPKLRTAPISAVAQAEYVQSILYR